MSKYFEISIIINIIEHYDDKIQYTYVGACIIIHVSVIESDLYRA